MFPNNQRRILILHTHTVIGDGQFNLIAVLFYAQYDSGLSVATRLPPESTDGLFPNGHDVFANDIMPLPTVRLSSPRNRERRVTARRHARAGRRFD